MGAVAAVSASALAPPDSFLELGVEAGRGEKGGVPLCFRDPRPGCRAPTCAHKLRHRQIDRQADRHTPSLRWGGQWPASPPRPPLPHALPRLQLPGLSRVEMPVPGAPSLCRQVLGEALAARPGLRAGETPQEAPPAKWPPCPPLPFPFLPGPAGTRMCCLTSGGGRRPSAPWVPQPREGQQAGPRVGCVSVCLNWGTWWASLSISPNSRLWGLD